ncbi:MAG: hypothetical protein KA745_06735 [Gemmatimonadales bacterium]|nr:hypothetical protein [Gemmatimonadales bacterium]
MARAAMSRSQNPIYFIASAEGCKVDRAKGIVFGVSVITGGVKAKGHDLWTDNTTLLQMKEKGDERGKVLVKENHKNPGGGTTGVDAMVGFLTDFRVEDGKTKADLHFYSSHPRRDLYLDAAENTPELFGLSAAFIPPEKGEVKAGKKMARVEELVSVDLVTTPAANPSGLFSAGVDSSDGAMSTNNSGAEDPILAAIKQLTGQFDAFKQSVEDRLTNIEAASQPELTLGDLAEMTDEQLAEAGYTREQVDALIETAIAEAEAAGAEAGEGGDATAGAAAPATEGAAAPAGSALEALTKQVPALEALTKQVQELQAKNDALVQRLEAEDAAAHQAAVNQEFAAVEEALETLSAENEALRTAVKSAGSKPVSAGRDIIGFETKGGKHSDGSFESIVELSVKGGKKRHIAMLEAIREHPSEYAAYKARMGVAKKLDAE